MSRLFNFHWKHLSEWCLWNLCDSKFCLWNLLLTQGKHLFKWGHANWWPSCWNCWQTACKRKAVSVRFRLRGPNFLHNRSFLAWKVTFWILIIFLNSHPLLKIDLLRQFYMTWFIGMVVFRWFNKYLKYMYIVVFIIINFGSVPQN